MMKGRFHYLILTYFVWVAIITGSSKSDGINLIDPHAYFEDYSFNHFQNSVQYLALQ